MSSSERITSITTTKASSFIKNSKERETLACNMISGFHLMKTKRRRSWRLRYTGANIKGETSRRVATIGKYPMKPSEAAKIAREWSVNHIDPLAEADCGFNRSKHRFLDPSQANPLENAVIIKHIEEVCYED